MHIFKFQSFISLVTKIKKTLLSFCKLKFWNKLFSIEFITALILLITAGISYLNYEFQNELYEEELSMNIFMRGYISPDHTRPYGLLLNLESSKYGYNQSYYFNVYNIGLKPARLLELRYYAYCNGKLVRTMKYPYVDFNLHSVIEVGGMLEGKGDNIHFPYQEIHKVLKQPYYCDLKFVLKTTRKKYTEEFKNIKLKF